MVGNILTIDCTPKLARPGVFPYNNYFFVVLAIFWHVCICSSGENLLLEAGVGRTVRAGFCPPQLPAPLPGYGGPACKRHTSYKQIVHFHKIVETKSPHQSGKILIKERIYHAVFFSK